MTAFRTKFSKFSASVIYAVRYICRLPPVLCRLVPKIAVCLSVRPSVRASVRPMFVRTCFGTPKVHTTFARLSVPKSGPGADFVTDEPTHDPRPRHPLTSIPGPLYTIAPSGQLDNTRRARVAPLGLLRRAVQT